MLVILLLILAVATAFLGGLCPKHVGSLTLRVISWFCVVAFFLVLWGDDFNPFLIGQIALVVFARSVSVVWGSIVMLKKFPAMLDFDSDSEHTGTFVVAFVSGLVAFLGFIIGAVIAYLIPYIVNLAKV